MFESDLRSQVIPGSLIKCTCAIIHCSKFTVILVSVQTSTEMDFA